MYSSPFCKDVIGLNFRHWELAGLHLTSPCQFISKTPRQIKKTPSSACDSSNNNYPLHSDLDTMSDWIISRCLCASFTELPAVVRCCSSRKRTATPAKPLAASPHHAPKDFTLPHWPSLGQNNHKFNKKVLSLFELLKVGILLASWHHHHWTNTCKRRIPKIL